MSSSAKNLLETFKVHACAGSLSVLLAAAAAPGAQAAQSPGAGRLDFLADAPLHFEAGPEQAGAPAPFIARGRDSTVLLSPDSATILVRESKAKSLAPSDPISSLEKSSAQVQTVRILLQNANPGGKMTGLDSLPGKANYLIGNDRTAWRTGVPLFGRVQVDDVYPGIRAIYHADASARLEYDFILQPGARPEQISLRFEGADKVRIDANGDLVLKIGSDEIRQHCPVIYQEIGGVRKEIAGGYRLTGKTTAGFRIGEYNRDLPLVIDPTLSFSTYLGEEKTDVAHGVGFDGNGNVFVAGETLSKGLAVSGFTTSNYHGRKYHGGHGSFGDAFVAKYDTISNSLVYVTYLGGNDDDGALGLFVDTIGNAYVTGFSDSPDFPIVPAGGALRSKMTGRNNNAFRITPIDAFVAELDPTGTQLVFSTLLGGDKRDAGYGITVIGNEVYVAGQTESVNFVPQANVGQTNLAGKADAFVVKFTAATATVGYSTYLGGALKDYATAIAVDTNGAAYVTGITSSTDFPTTHSIIFPIGTNFITLDQLNLGDRNSPSDAFVSKLAPDGTLLYSSYLGGDEDDVGLGIAADDAGNAYVTGHTASKNFPTNVFTLPPDTASFSTNIDVLPPEFTTFPTNVLVVPKSSVGKFTTHVFVTKVSPDGATADYSTAFGGKGSADQGKAISVDRVTGEAYVAGVTTTRSFFPTSILVFTSPTNSFSTNNPVFTDFRAATTNSSGKKIHSSSSNDAFVAVLAADGASFTSSILLGGAGNDIAHAIAFDATQNAASVAGQTSSDNFRITTDAPQKKRRGKADAFVSRIQFP